MQRIMFSFGLAALTGACVAAEAPPSATELGCTSCHALDHKIVGPSWMEVAKRYADKRNDPKFFDQLVKNVSNGSEDRWGTIPMVANDPAGRNRGQIVEILKYVLSLSSPPEAKNRK